MGMKGKWIIKVLRVLREGLAVMPDPLLRCVIFLLDRIFDAYPESLVKFVFLN